MRFEKLIENITKGELELRSENGPAYKLVHLYDSSSSRGDFVQEAMTLFKLDNLTATLVWSVIDAYSDLHSMDHMGEDL